MKALSRGISFMAVALLLVAGSASATFVPVGDPLDIGSWSQGFNEYVSGGQFSHYQFLMVAGAGGPFDVPTGFTSSGGWGQTANDGTLLIADGPSTTTYNDFTLYFAAANSGPVFFHGQAWSPAGILVDNADFYYGGYGNHGSDPSYYHGGGWDIGPGTWNTAEVPEPISMMMLGCLGAGMFVARKLRGKRAT
jgi:hypothetical protein